MITVSKNDLASGMSEYFRRVEEDGEELIVTHDGVPVLKVMSLGHKRPASEVFADLRGKAVFHGDVNEPTTDEWGEV